MKFFCKEHSSMQLKCRGFVFHRKRNIENEKTLFTLILVSIFFRLKFINAWLSIKHIMMNSLLYNLYSLSCLTLCDPMDCSLPGSSVHEDSLGKNTGVGCHGPFQGIFPIQGSDPGLPHCRWILYHLWHQESPIILEWVAYPFSRGSSQPRNRTGDSCTVGRFFTSWATREALKAHYLNLFPHYLTFKQC